MQEKIKILNYLFHKLLKYILFFYFIFLYKHFYALENINKTILLDKRIFLYKKKYNNIQDNIKYEANIIKYDFLKKKSYLIGNASINYYDIFIQANYIEINWKTNTICAYSQYDQSNISLKKILILYKKKKYYCDNFFFNLKTQIGIGNDFFYEGKQGVIVAKSIKKREKNIFFINESFYTHDSYFKNKKDNLSDYFLKTKFIKYVNNKFLITGPILMYLYQIPTPIFLPFIYLSTNTKRNFTILIPHIGRNNYNEYFIENLGFFSSISNNWDIKIAGSIYHKSSWKIDIKTRYNFKYKSLGKIELNYQKFFNKELKSKIYEIKWKHITKNINQQLTLFANIYYLNNKNISINNDYLSSNISSISVKKHFDTLPLTLIINNNLNHYQKTLSLPNIRVIIDNMSPLKNTNNILLKNFNINYNMNINNIFYYNDKHFFSQKMFEIMNTNLEQDLLINTKIDLFKYFRITPNIIYNEKKIFLIKKHYNHFIKDILKTLIEFKLSINLFFTLYGIKEFPTNTIIKALRHKIDTQIIYSYSPIFIKNYNFLYNDHEVFDKSKKIKFLFTNNVQAKVNNNNHNYQKINLIDHLDIFTTYDISKKLWSDIVFHGNTTIKNFLFNISGHLSLNKNTNINFLYKTVPNLLQLFSVKDFWIAIGYKLDSYISKNYNNRYKKKGKIRYENFFYDDHNYAHYNILWNLNLNLNYSNLFTNNIIDKSLLLILDSNISITPFWKIGINIDYDIMNNKIMNALFIFDRDLRSFKIKFIWNTNNTCYFYLGINK